MKAWPVRVHRGRLEPPPRGDILVGTGPTRAGSWMALEIADTGQGIRSEDVGRVFDRFYRADRSRTETEGSRLGLSIVREIILRHHGLIAVASAPGGGTTVTVLLPAGRT